MKKIKDKSQVIATTPLQAQLLTMAGIPKPKPTSRSNTRNARTWASSRRKTLNISQQNDKDLEITSIINWQKGDPTEYGSYLVLHRNHLGRLVIDHDIWFDDSQRWQSQWRGIVAWCAFSDIDVRLK